MKIAAKKTSLTAMIISSNLSKRRSHSEIANKKRQDKSHLAEYVSSSELATMTKAVVPKSTQKTQIGLFTTSASG